VSQLDAEIALFQKTAPADAPCLSDLSDSALQDSAGWAFVIKCLGTAQTTSRAIFSPAIVHSLSGESRCIKQLHGAAIFCQGGGTSR
jgi:hypothetical protein